MKDFSDIPHRPLRAPSEVMRLSRMGSMFPTRLSFLRTLMRNLAAENARVTRSVWNIDADGFGHAVYTIRLGGYDYSLVAVSTDLPPEMRTDRVIATAWDSSYVLFDGVPDVDDVARICAAAPKQEAARFTVRELVLSRANKSVRAFSHVVDRLRAGRQPDADLIRSTGYLMRTTAVYGNGKFGIADRACLSDRPCMDGPFMAEMLTVWMIRGFTHDLVEHLGGALLERDLKRHLGVGNSTGLGMAPFLVNHPVLLNNWMMARETALARVRGIVELDTRQVQQIMKLADRAAQHLAEWSVPDAGHQSRIEHLRDEWAKVRSYLTEDRLQRSDALNEVFEWAQSLSLDAQELMVALLLEPFGELIDGLADCMSDPFGPMVLPISDTKTLADLIDRHCAWALTPDYDSQSGCRQFWYVSAAKEEPRLGDRFEEEGAELESPLDIGRRIKALRFALPAQSVPVSTFLESAPEHGLAIARVAAAARYPYGEIQDNLIGEDCLPIDMLRCKLAFFGASKFDPKSDRWTRITLCQGAPLFDELQDRADSWWLPVFGQ